MYAVAKPNFDQARAYSKSKKYHKSMAKIYKKKRTQTGVFPREGT